MVSYSHAGVMPFCLSNMVLLSMAGNIVTGWQWQSRFLPPTLQNTSQHCAWNVSTHWQMLTQTQIRRGRGCPTSILISQPPPHHSICQAASANYLSSSGGHHLRIIPEPSTPPILNQYHVNPWTSSSHTGLSVKIHHHCQVHYSFSQATQTTNNKNNDK